MALDRPPISRKPPEYETPKDGIAAGYFETSYCTNANLSAAFSSLNHMPAPTSTRILT